MQLDPPDFATRDQMMQELMQRCYFIEIPNWKPPSVNKLMGHWRNGRRLKQAAAQMIATYAHMAKIPKATCKRLVSISVTQSGKGRTGDSDNLLKATLDALKTTGYIKDDNQTWLQYNPPIIRRGKETKTIITLQDLP